MTLGFSSSRSIRVVLQQHCFSGTYMSACALRPVTVLYIWARSYSRKKKPIGFIMSVKFDTENFHEICQKFHIWLNADTLHEDLSTFNRHKSLLFQSNGIKLLGLHMRYEHYASAPQCCLSCFSLRISVHCAQSRQPSAWKNQPLKQPKENKFCSRMHLVGSEQHMHTVNGMFNNNDTNEAGS